MSPEAMVTPFPIIKRGRDEREFLPAALEILDTPASPAGRWAALTIVAAAAVAVGWACLGQVDIIATASGRLVPVGRTKVVQPLEAGRVRAIAVGDGDRVKAGQVLVELDPVEVRADRDRYARDLLQQRLELARLEGLVAALGGDARPRLVDPPAAPREALAAAAAAMTAQAAEQAAKVAGLDRQIAEKAAEADEAQATITKLHASLPWSEQEAATRRQLKEMQFGNKLAWYEAEQRLVEQRQDLPVQQRHREQALASRQALAQQREETVASYAKTVLGQLAETRAKVSELTAEAAKSAEKLSRQTLKAPIDGTVQQLAVHTVGGVVTPGQTLLAVVPEGGGLVVEAKVENRDVGFVAAGQPVEAKIETFAFTRYGLIEGHVLSLSRDVVADPGQDLHARPAENDPSADDADKADRDKAQPGYIARIALDRDWMETENGRVPLGPGMTITAEIKTGRRRIIGYLLSPLARHVQESGHER